jgi:hypothetical protein
MILKAKIQIHSKNGLRSHSYCAPEVRKLRLREVGYPLKSTQPRAARHNGSSQTSLDPCMLTPHTASHQQGPPSAGNSTTSTPCDPKPAQ